MEPNRFGRRLGIGVRVASRMVKERAAQPASANPQAAVPRPSTPKGPATPPRPARNLAEPARRVGVGTRRFGQAFFGPFVRVSRSLLLEVTGLLFALFALFFAQNAWRTRASAVRGVDHAHFLIYAIIGAVFLYFSISSFFKANRRGKPS